MPLMGNEGREGLPIAEPEERRQRMAPLRRVSCVVASLVLGLGAALLMLGWASSRPRALKGHSGPVVGLTFSRDGALLASASWDNTVRLWSVSDGRCVRTLDHGKIIFNCVTLS